MTRLEIAAVSLEDALAAKEGGAHSIEISYDLSVGGLTPDFDLVRTILEAVQSEDFAVNVLVRPHARHFIYSEAEVQHILEDIKKFVALGVDGIVFGAQTASDELDIDLICRDHRCPAPPHAPSGNRQRQTSRNRACCARWRRPACPHIGTRRECVGWARRAAPLDR